MNDRYDFVVVGARCAGATFASFMARAGAKVLLVDRAALPSDVVLSTHTLHPSGMAVVDELGVGDAVRAVTPEMKALRLEWNGSVLDVPFTSRHGEHCPRRKRFDHLLQKAAHAQGVELIDRTQAVGLVWEHGRVVGVELSQASGRRWRVCAPWVIGADGRNSKVGDWVGAAHYYDYEPPRGMYWSYWPAPKGWGQDERYPGGMYIGREGTSISIAFHTDDDQVLVGTLPLRSQVREFRTEPLAALRRALSTNARLGQLVAAEPLERPRGYLGERYFFRRAVGPGWLLLGDAGLHKDFLSGDGMSEALLQARNAAHAILDTQPHLPTERRLERWWHLRDIHALPDYRNTQTLADDVGRGELNRVLLPKIAANPHLQRAFAQTFSRERSPFDTVPLRLALLWVLSATLRGNRDVWREFIARGKLVAAVKREQHRLRRKLAAITA